MYGVNVKLFYTLCITDDFFLEVGYPNLRVVLKRALKTGVEHLYTCTRVPPVCSFEGGRACLSFETKFGFITLQFAVEMSLN